MNVRPILITGANGSLGQAIAQAFLDETERNHLYLGVHQRLERAEALAAAHPDRCHVLRLDVTERGDWSVAVRHITQAHGRIDVLVNNAGFHADMLLAQMTQEAWRSVMAANLDGVFHGCQAVLPSMIGERHGRIVNVASLSALAPVPGQANYAAAKAGVVALSQSLAKEVARIGITVNTVCPGYIDTEALASLDPNTLKSTAARIPMRRLGTVTEVAAAIRFLACPEASYITGSILKVDGGLL